ncbi:unnamed protein product [Ascophyllum nodosum]
MKYPPNCTSIHQPMDQGIIAATELNYRKELHDVRVSTMRVAETLRAQAKERKMVVGTMGLAEGHHPYMLAAADLLKLVWDNITQKTTARCWVKTKTLPLEMEASLDVAYGKNIFYHRCDVCDSSVTGAGVAETNSTLQ